MSDQKIKITIDAVGNITTEAIGFTGQACKGPVDKMVKALAGQVTSSKDKPEMQMLTGSGGHMQMHG